MAFFSRRFTQFFSRPASFYTRVAVGVGLQNERRDSWPRRLPKRVCYGNTMPINRWSSDQVPLQDRKSKRIVDFKGTKRVHIKTQKSDFDKGLNFRLFGLGRFLWKNVCPITSQLVSLWHDEQSKQFKNYSEFVISA